MRNTEIELNNKSAFKSVDKEIYVCPGDVQASSCSVRTSRVIKKNVVFLFFFFAVTRLGNCRMTTWLHKELLWEGFLTLTGYRTWSKKCNSSELLLSGKWCFCAHLHRVICPYLSYAVDGNSLPNRKTRQGLLFCFISMC